jgi:hypothetical protein
MTPRVGFELDVGGGTTLRGIRIEGGSAARLLMLHDLGRDLDEFGRLPEALADIGCDVLAVDLPGHGISDELPDGGTVPSLLVEALRRVRDTVPLGLVASGRTATVGVMVGRPHGVETQVLVNPVLDDSWLAGERREHSIRLVMHAEGAHLVGTDTQRFAGKLVGEKMLLHHLGVESGPASIAEDSTPLDHVTLFVQRYLIAQLRGGFSDATGRR